MILAQQLVLLGVYKDKEKDKTLIPAKQLFPCRWLDVRKNCGHFSLQMQKM